MKPKIIIALVLFILLVILLVQNMQEVVFRMFFWKISMSQMILVPLAVIVGFIFGFFVGRGGMKKLG
jgi:uncharacterized integral membrane protein